MIRFIIVCRVRCLKIPEGQPTLSIFITTSFQTRDKVASGPGCCELSHANQNRNKFVMVLISLVDCVI